MMLKSLVKTSGLHYKHLALRAVMMDDMGWQRPRRYSSPEKESQAARTNVGLCDISPLGKFDIRGNDMDAFLRKLFGNTVKVNVSEVFRTVASKRESSALQAATCYRLAADHAFITCPAAQVESSIQVLELQRSGCLNIVDVTSGRAVLRLVGPQSWGVLSKLTEISLEPQVLGDLKCAEGDLAKVHVLIARKDYGGHLSYELYCGRDVSEHVWDAVMEAGREFNIVPFGVEAESMLLEE